MIKKKIANMHTSLHAKSTFFIFKNKDKVTNPQ